MDDLETTVKVIAVGNGRVGKTSMTTLYCKGVFTEDYKKTIGVDFMEKEIEIEDSFETVRLMVWDTAGQEEFDSLTSRYYKGAGAALLVFSCVDRDSFDALPSWKEKVQAEAGNIAMCMVQNKMDLHAQALMTDEEVEAMAAKLGVRLYRTCTKQNLNVKEAFEYVAMQYILRGAGGETAVAHITDFRADDEETKAGGAGAGTSAAAAAAAAAPAPAAPVRNPHARGADAAAAAANQPVVQMKTGAAAGAGRPKPRATVGGDDDTFQLHTRTGPSKQRTGGKKSGFCVLL